MGVGKTSLLVFLTKIAGLIITFVGIAVFARTLGATVLGILFLFQAILSVSQLVSNLGTRISVEKRISEGSRADDYLTTAIVIKFAIIAAVSIPIYLLSGYINSYVGADVAELLLLALIINEFAGLMMNVLKGEQRVFRAATIQLSHSITWIGVGLFLTSIGYGALGLIYAYIVGYFVKFTFGFISINTGFGRPSRELAISLINYAKYSAIPEIDNYFHSWMDVLIIGFFLTQAAVGAYEVAWRVAGPIMLLTGAIGTTIFPKMSSLDANGSRDAVGELLSRVITPSLVLVIPSFFGVLLFSQEILGLIFGAEFTMAWIALIIIVAGKVPRAIRKIVGLSLMAIDRPDLVTRAAIGEITSNLILNLVLIYYFGLVGAAIGTTVSMTLGTIQRIYYISDFVELQVPYRELGWCLLSSLGMFFALYLVQTTVEITTVVQLIGFVSTGAALYGVFILLYQPLRVEVVEQTRAVIR